jgi:hypothetical protein
MDPFVSGLSVTLSQTTAKLLLKQSTIQSNKPNHHECSAEQFVLGGEADDHTLSRCLGSLGVYPSYTRDTFGNKRFMHFSPTPHFGGSGIGSSASRSGGAGGIRRTRNILLRNKESGGYEPDWYKNFSWTAYDH